MKMTDLLQSNFKHYRFVIYEDSINKTHYDNIRINLGKKRGVGIIEFDLIKPNDLPRHYDIGFSLSKNAKMTAENVAWFIDKTRLFKFYKMEYVAAEETLYIICKPNKAGE